METQCKAIRSMESVFSQAQKVVLYVYLGGEYNCPLCKQVHKLPKWESEENEEVVQA